MIFIIFINIWHLQPSKTILIVISANILAGVLYSKEHAHQYLNFGGLGTAIAHEMNHAFDLTVRPHFVVGYIILILHYLLFYHQRLNI